MCTQTLHNGRWGLNSPPETLQIWKKKSIRIYVKAYLCYTPQKKKNSKLTSIFFLNAAPRAQSLPIYSPVGLLNSKTALCSMKRIQWMHPWWLKIYSHRTYVNHIAEISELLWGKKIQELRSRSERKLYDLVFLLKLIKKKYHLSSYLDSYLMILLFTKEQTEP